VTTKSMLAIATFWTSMYGPLFVIVSVILFFDGESAGHTEGMPTWFVTLGLLHLATILLACVLLFYYLGYLIRTQRIDTERKVLWAFALLFGTIVAMPIFYWKYVRTDSESIY
jgi:hypothetical protein